MKLQPCQLFKVTKWGATGCYRKGALWLNIVLSTRICRLLTHFMIYTLILSLTLLSPFFGKKKYFKVHLRDRKIGYRSVGKHGWKFDGVKRHTLGTSLSQWYGLCVLSCVCYQRNYYGSWRKNKKKNGPDLVFFSSYVAVDVYGPNPRKNTGSYPLQKTRYA